MNGARLPNFAASRAVLVGVAAYHDPGLVDLPAVAENVAALLGVLTDPTLSGFADAQVTVVLDPADARAVMAPVLQAAAAADDLVLVYFAGHGILAGDGVELHLATGDSVPEQPWTSLPFAYLARVLRRAHATTKILLLDCCYSGRAARDLMGDAVHLAVNQVGVDGVYVMTSTSGTRAAKAPTGHRYTAFTGGLIHAMRHGTATAGDLLGMPQLFQVVRARMHAAGWPIPEQYHHNNAGNLALVRNATRSSGADARRRRPAPQAWAAMAPEQAAAALDALAPADANAVVAGAPAVALAGVLPQLSSISAAARLAALDDSQIVAVLRLLAPQTAADVLAKLDQPRRGTLLDQLSAVDTTVAAAVVCRFGRCVLRNIVRDSPGDQLRHARQVIAVARADARQVLYGGQVAADQPAHARRQLSQELRQLREATGATQHAAASALGWSPSKLARIERGNSAIADSDLHALLARFAVDAGSELAGRLVQLAQITRVTPWWASSRGLRLAALTRLAGLEGAATAVRYYSSQLVPGLLQTRDYARSAINHAYFDHPDAELNERRVAFRLHRQTAALERQDPVELTVIFHEAVFRNTVGSPSIMREQVAYLVDVAARQNVTFRLFPFAEGAVPAPAPFLVMEFGDVGDSPLAYAEGSLTETFIDNPRHVRGYQHMLTAIENDAIDSEATYAYLQGLEYHDQHG